MERSPCGTRHHEGENRAFVALLRACIKTKDLIKGIRVHAHLLKRGLLEDCFFTLVTMYAKCGAPAKATDLLCALCVRDVISWTEVIAGFIHQGQGEEALQCFDQMQLEGVSPNAVTFSCILKACGSIGALVRGEQIHDEITRQGLLQKDIVLGTALVDMYAKLGALAKARAVLEKIPIRDVFAWTALIAGYAQHDQGENAITCFEEMQNEGLSPDARTFTCILKALGSIGAVDKGKQVHFEICKQGLLQNNPILGSALVDMYAKCGALEKAQDVLETLPFLNVVSWSALIAGFIQHGQGERALECYGQMRCKGIIPNVVTLACILKACGSIGAAHKGEQIHNEIVQLGLLKRDIVLGNALVDMYAKCGALAKARQVLEELPAQDVVTWSTLIAGYVQQGQGDEALQCYEWMQEKGLSPNAVTYVCILKACGKTGSFGKGKRIHDEIAKQGLLRDNIVLGTALLDFYVKCGALVKAHKLLEELSLQDVVSWTALIAGYAQQGQVDNALNCFEQMQHKGIAPGEATFACMLYAFSHSGLIDEGFAYFANMTENYGTKANEAHYSCLVDLFGRAGHLDEAVTLVEKMPSPECSFLWPALLSACQKSKDVAIGRWAFEHALQVVNADAAVFVSLANIYASAKLWEENREDELICCG